MERKTLFAFASSRLPSNLLCLKPIDKVTAAKLVIDRYGLDGTSQETRVERTNEDVEPRLGDKRTVLINDISSAMRKLNYAIYRGSIYKKYEGAIYTYSYKCVVKAFVNSLAAN